MKQPTMTSDRILRIISNCEYFAGLSAETRRRLAATAHLKEFTKRERVFLENRPGECVFLLIRGSVQLTKAAPSGAEVVIRTVRAFEVFAEAVLFETDVYPVTATAVTQALLMAFPRSDFIRLLDEPAFRADYLRSLTSRLRYLAERVRNLASFDVEQRFFAFLLEQYGMLPEIRTELSKKDIAAAIGAAPETFSRMVRRLQIRGHVRWNGRRITIRPDAWNGVEADIQESRR